MAVTFNGTERFIEVTDPADLVLDAQRDLYSAWKDWQQASTVNAGYAPAFRTFGGDETVEGQNAPRYYFLTNFWRVRINNGQVVAVALNLYSDNFATPYVVVAGSGVSDRNSDAVSVNSEAIEYSSYNDKVTVNTNSPYSGTQFPVGTPRQPVNNLTDALAIANDRGFKRILLLDNQIIDSGLDFTEFIFEGVSQSNTWITVDPSANVTRCVFENMTLSGTLDGGSSIVKCNINTLNYVNGIVDSCIIDGPVTLGGIDEAIFIDCRSGVAGTATPTIDCGGDSPPIIIRNWTGGLRLTNKTGDTNSASIDLTSGQLILDPTVSSGNITVRGIGKLINNSTGTAMINAELLDSVNLNKTLFINGRVSVNVNNGSTGTDFPKGTIVDPINNPSDGKFIADFNNITGYEILGNLVLNADHSEWFFNGQGGSTASVDPNGFDVSGSKFQSLRVTGDVMSESQIVEIRNGPLGNVSNLRATVVECGVFGNISFGTTPNNHRFVRCQQGNVTPVFNCTNLSTGQIIFALWDGEMVFTNLTSGNVIIDSLASHITLDSTTCTGGTVVVRGVGKLVDENGNPIDSNLDVNGRPVETIWNGGVTILNELLTAGNVGGGSGSSVWTVAEKDKIISDVEITKDQAEISAIHAVNKLNE